MSKIGALRDLLVNLLQEHERDGAIPTSARFLFYELVQPQFYVSLRQKELAVMMNESSGPGSRRQPDPVLIWRQFLVKVV